MSNRHENKLEETVKNLENSIPNIKLAYAEWLPESVKKAIKDHLFFISGNGDIRIFNAMSGIFNKKIKELPKFEKIFNNKENNELIWLKLDKISPEKTHKFVSRLFFFSDNFARIDDGSKVQKEVKSFENIINNMDTLTNLLNENKINFFALSCRDETDKILENIQQFKKKSLPFFDEKLHHLKEMNKLNYSRETKHENAEAIYFAREISDYFRNNFEQPLNEITVIITNLLFNTDYEETNISIFYNAVKKRNNKPYIQKIKKGETDHFYK